MTIKDKYMGKFRIGHYWQELDNQFWVLAKFIEGRPKEFLDYRAKHINKIEDAAKYASKRTATLVCHSRHECCDFQPLYIQAKNRRIKQNYG